MLLEIGATQGAVVVALARVRFPTAHRSTLPSAVSVVISEPLAEAFHFKEGDTITLPTPSGPQELRVAGVFYDYRTDGPSIWMDISQFRRFWQDTHLNAVRLFLKDPARTPQMQARLQERYGGRYRLLALSHQDLRQGILRIFDETFALTYALEGVAVVVAVFGIITTFLVLIMERERELALLQAIGASRRQILGMVLTESGLASFLSFILGAACGFGAGAGAVSRAASFMLSPIFFSVPLSRRIRKSYSCPSANAGLLPPGPPPSNSDL